MSPSKIVLDTNVLFSGLYSSAGASHQVLRLIDSGRLRPVISVPLLFEYEDVLRRYSEKLMLSNRQIEVVLDNLCFLSDFQKVYFLWRPYLRDSHDDHVLEVTVASRTPYIVTHNIKDFTGAESFGIQAIPPQKLLEMLK